MITADQLQRDLTKYTVDHSRYEEARNYIGLSSIWDCPAAIINRYLHGNGDPGVRGRLKCYKGYQIEDDVVERLIAVYGSGRDAFERIKRDVPIILFDGLVQGHMELTIDGIPIEVKSVPLDEHLPQRIPKKVLWQVNAYLRYLPSDRCIVVYESRESGLLRTFDIWADKEFGERIEKKVEQLVWYAKDGSVPDCECGRCATKGEDK
jgi:hypothetical protein